MEGPLTRKLSEKWVFPWFSRLKSAFLGMQARNFDAIARVRTARESEVVADFISSSPSRRPWWLCAEVVLIQSDIATFILFY